MSHYELSLHPTIARTGVPVAVQIEELFGDADHFITHFGFDYDPKVWNTVVYFGDRYMLSMAVDVEIEYDSNIVKQVGTPNFWLVGAEKVTISPSGQVGASFSGDERWFSLAEWKQLYESGGDFRKIGITIREEAVPGYDKYVAASRRDHIPISLTDDSTR